MQPSDPKNLDTGNSESSSDSSSYVERLAMPDVVITVDSPSKNKRRISGDGPVNILPSNLGSEENLLESDALNYDLQKESLRNNNRDNLSSNFQLNQATANSPSITEAGLGARCGLSSLQVPFSLGRSSKDADSICTAQSHIMSGEKFDPTTQCWWKHPKVRENWRVFFAAFGLLLIGTGLLVMGIVVTVIPDIGFQSYVFFIAGAFCFIPGAYHVVYVYCAVKGRKGYDFYQLPLFN